MYRGDYEPASVRLLRRFLHAGDTFVDVGANMGYLAAVGLDCVGPSGSVHAFEPVPELYDRLTRLGTLNPGYRLLAHPCALSDAEGQAGIHVNRSGNIGWNTMVPGFMKPTEVARVADVSTRRLDQYLDTPLMTSWTSLFFARPPVSFSSLHPEPA
jgi:FkbM family methyltransferase